jgi:hypothetical protein
MTFKKLAVAVGISVAFGLGAAGNARADAMANALIDVSNFILTGPAGVPLNITDFSQISFQDTLVNNALLNPGGFDAQFAATNTFSAATDAPMACVGAPCAGIPQNLFVPATVPPTSTYARSDSLLTGVPITGVPFALGVRAGTIAETSINTNASGGSSSDILLTSSFQFVLAHDIAGADIHFDATTFLRAWTAALSLPGTTAGAGFKWELTLVDGIGGATLIDWIPNGNIATGTQTGLTVTSEGCNLVANASATFNQPSAPTENCTGSFAAVTNFVLLANHPYSFTIHHNVSTQATEVIAEPGALALLGIGLAGLGFVRRRWS